jgi:hypothetical protein
VVLYCERPSVASDEPRAFERQHHLANRRWTDVETFLHVGFGRRPPVQARIGVDKRQILACLCVKVFAERLKLAIPACAACGCVTI